MASLPAGVSAKQHDQCFGPTSLEKGANPEEVVNMEAEEALHGLVYGGELYQRRPE